MARGNANRFLPFSLASSVCGGRWDDFDEDALDCNAAGVKCPRRVTLGFDRGESDFVAPAGIGF